MNDRDGLTDMTLLHYTCKSGAHGIGEYVASLLMACMFMSTRVHARAPR